MPFDFRKGEKLLLSEIHWGGTTYIIIENGGAKYEGKYKN